MTIVPEALALFLLFPQVAPVRDLQDLQGSLERQLIVASGNPKRGGSAAAKEKVQQSRVIRVPGGWKLPGDDTVYPYNPLVPPDLVDPVPRPPGSPDRRKR